MKHSHHPLEGAILEAEAKIDRLGPHSSEVTDRDIQLAIGGYSAHLSRDLAARSRPNGNGRRDMLMKGAPTFVGGGGLAALVMAILEKLAG